MIDPAALEAEADRILAADAGLTLKQFKRRRGDRNTRWEAQVDAFPSAADAIAEEGEKPTLGRANGAVASYLYTRSRLCAPSRAFDAKVGAIAIEGDRHLDMIDVEQWATQQTDATKSLLYDVTLMGWRDGGEQEELALRWGVTARTVRRWRKELPVAIEQGRPFTPRRTISDANVQIEPPRPRRR